jgi:hypothetical protein
LERRALILYSSLTGNTAKIAGVFADTFKFYGFHVKSLNINAKTDWEKEREETYFDDYDIICLGTPIIAGLPFDYINYSLGLTPWRGTGVGPRPGPPEDLSFRRLGVGHIGVKNPQWKPALGIVFATFGGSFYGPDESLATLELLKQYLKLRAVDTVGMFACCGSCNNHTEPEAQPVSYTTSDGETHPGTVFAHYNTPGSPKERDLLKAKFFIQDIVEDMFFTASGDVRKPESTYISIS